MRLERAVEIGQAALMRLATQPELFAQFMTETGIEATDLRSQAENPEFLGFVLTFIAQNEEEAEALCREEALTPESFAAARAALPGGAEMHWT